MFFQLKTFFFLNANFDPTKISHFITVFFKGAMLMK